MDCCHPVNEDATKEMTTFTFNFQVILRVNVKLTSVVGFREYNAGNAMKGLSVVH